MQSAVERGWEDGKFVYVVMLADFYGGNCAVADVCAALESCGHHVPDCYLDGEEYDPGLHPFATLVLGGDEEALDVYNHCALGLVCLRVWALGADLEESLRLCRNVPDRVREGVARGERSFAVDVSCRGRKMGNSEKGRIREEVLEAIAACGPVNLKSPDDSLHIAVLQCPEEYEFVAASADMRGKWGLPTIIPSRRWSDRVMPRSDDRYKMNAVIVGREVGKGASSLRLAARTELSMRKRVYMGPTALNPDLTVIMTALGKVRRGHLVLDPFAGTGSLLLGAAACGAHSVGMELDYLTAISGKAGKIAVDNFAAFPTYRPEMIRSDFLHSPLGRRPLVSDHSPLSDTSKHPEKETPSTKTIEPSSSSSSPFRTVPIPMFQAVVTDPPYGIRAAAKTVRSAVIDVDPDLPHAPKMDVLLGEELLVRLLDFAAASIVPGGRLVYLLPVARDDSIDSLPQHPLLRLVAVASDVLGLAHARWIVTMERNDEPYDPRNTTQYRHFTIQKLRQAGVDHDATGDRISQLRQQVLAEADEEEPLSKRPRKEQKRIARIARVKKRAASPSASSETTQKTQNPKRITTLPFDRTENVLRPLHKGPPIPVPDPENTESILHALERHPLPFIAFPPTSYPPEQPVPTRESVLRQWAERKPWKN